MSTRNYARENTIFFKRHVWANTFHNTEFNKYVGGRCRVSRKNVGGAWDPRGPQVGLVPPSLNR